jgi:hypothetical protein
MKGNTMTSTGLTGSTALITGATSGIGRATAVLLAQRGAHVLVSGRDAARGDAAVAAIRAAGGKAGFIAANLASGDPVRALARHAAELGGGHVELDRPADVTEVIPRAGVLAVVFGPDGSTVIRRDDTGGEAWAALWNGDEAHDVQATGMLSAIVAPLAASDVPVWVVSSYDGDLVPANRLGEASEVLEAAGHHVV